MVKYHDLTHVIGSTPSDPGLVDPQNSGRYIICIKFNGKNNKQWSFHLKNFMEGQGMLGYLDGTESKPTIET